MAYTSLSQMYDANRDVYLEREAYEREMQFRRMKEEDYLRQQQSMFAQQSHHQGGMLSQSQIFQGQLGQAISQAAKPDPKDPLAFLNKAHKTLLLTGEAS
jgi:hypothetical protein